MLTLVIASALAQAPVHAAPAARSGRAEAATALRFIRRRDPATADRLGGELRPWLAGPLAGVHPTQRPTVRAAATELRTMFEGHRAMWGGDPGFSEAARAATAAHRAFEREAAGLRP